MKSLIRILVLTLLGLTLMIPTIAQQTPPTPTPSPFPPPVRPIVEPPFVPGVSTNPDWLSVDYHRATIRVEEQIATTEVDMQFTNHGEQLAEGTFVFPLPEGAAVDRLTMWVDGLAIDAKILRAEEARAIYDEIVRQYRDPALLEYIGRDLLQASVFPIPPGESRRIEIVYGQLLEPDNGLLHINYPLRYAGVASRRVDQMSISVEVSGSTPIGAVYSPSHNIALFRENDTAFRAGFETTGYIPDQDFSLYFGLASENIDLKLMTYRESAEGDGFFLLMVQPPTTIDEARIQPKDVILVLDQSGSMQGSKWTQAQQAANIVLEKLNPRDRFNIVAFSTGWRVYAPELLPASDAAAAAGWVNSLFADGGTDINGALLTALDMVDAERSTTILFLTDGEPTEGETDINAILSNLSEAARPNARIFSFGVGDDVNTVLLDRLVKDFRGTGAYVRPTERIDEEVASLYNKISAPVMTDVALNIDGATVDWLYPSEMPDIFAGEQLTLVGRYRSGSENVNVSLVGKVDGEAQQLDYGPFRFNERAGGEAFIAQLWATRRIGDLLNTIRLNGENPELVESVVNLSLRYGIITPYTSFLIEEDDILTEQGRRAAMDDFAEEAEALADTVTGAGAVDAADFSGQMQRATAPQAPAPMAMGTPTPAATMNAPAMGGAGNTAPAEMQEEPAPQVNPIQTVGGKTFILQNGVWTDTTYEPDNMTLETITFLSDAYFDLLDRFPQAGQYLALGDQVIVVLEGTAYQIQPE